jgi:putative chitinase
MITLQQLKQIIPGAKHPEVYLPHLNELMPKYGIDSPIRQAAFIAQIAHESGSLNYVREIASGDAYEGRKDLGNIYPGDGRKFKGRGLIQITGRVNYLALSHHIFKDASLTMNPELLAIPQYAVLSACWFWNGKGLNDVADKPETWTRLSKNGRTYTKIQWISRTINGGLNGIAERVHFYEKAKSVLL